MGLALLPMLGGCRGPLSVLDPAGPSAGAIAQVWWWMFGVAVAVLVLMVVLGALAMRGRRGGQGEDAGADAHRFPGDGARQRRIARRCLIGGGLLLPGVAITALLVFGSPAGFHQLPWPGAAAAPLRVEVTGHQWWWEVHYPDTGQRLRNELRLPAGRAVDVHTRSADVIHGFWVPRLGGKLDAVPGRTLVVRLQADRPGTYRGVCAEFCGAGHAHMPMVVQAMPAEDFDAWLNASPAAARTPRPPAVAAAFAQEAGR
ncbi:cytochrome c oxidase subunit II [Pseudacidovorax intermedius]|uniref:cytochrome c oxidase subunit II n=1 Tax=Pseudacidovorax intermedius TaxID=433924 RepID=UPI0019D39852|nr:cytochrome c oxidase subunit II [Pseudacidovorax intermedius]